MTEQPLADPSAVDRSRSVVITGASRGLGLASAAHLHRLGWTVVAGMRSPEVGIERLRAATGASTDDPRLLAVQIDLDDPASIAAAAATIVETVGAPDAVVHNAGVAEVGSVEEMPLEAYERIFSTNFFGPVLLTKELLPAMRAASRGRIVVVSSQGGVRGMPAISAYSAAKGALERWAESLAQEVAPFGLGVSVIVTGTFRTDILELTYSHADHDGPYADLHDALEGQQGLVLRMAGPPVRFARGLVRELDDPHPFSRRAVGPDARAVLVGSTVLTTRTLQRIVRFALRLPKPGSHSDDPMRYRVVATDRE